MSAAADARDERRGFGLDKSRRLRKSAEFQAVRSKGRSCAHPLLVLYARPNQLQLSRIGISVSKRVGNAVARNRTKRLMREAVRLQLPAVASGWDLLFIARAPIAAADFGQVCGALDQLLRRSGLLAGATRPDPAIGKAHGVAQEE